MYLVQKEQVRLRRGLTLEKDKIHKDVDCIVV